MGQQHQEACPGLFLTEIISRLSSRWTEVDREPTRQGA